MLCCSFASEIENQIPGLDALLVYRAWDLDVAVGGNGGEESGGITARHRVSHGVGRGGVGNAESSGELGGVKVYGRCSADGGDGGGQHGASSRVFDVEVTELVLLGAGHCHNVKQWEVVCDVPAALVWLFKCAARVCAEPRVIYWSFIADMLWGEEENRGACV